MKEFAKGDITFQEVDETWLDKFKEFLTTKVSQNTAVSYFQAIKQIFRLAKRDRIIIHNPAENIRNFTYRNLKIEHLD